MTAKKLGARVWLVLILIGLFGQFAWTIENMYFNVFLYNTISTDPGYIAAMVGWSAAAATLTTLLMGALSDRIGKRKAFICGGYLLWGLSTAAFGLITKENAARLFPGANAAAAAATLVVIMDCVMTFFGSTANDAAFNAYVTDVTDSSNRGRAESVLAILPLISMLVIFGLFDGLTQQGRWREFFGIFGAAVSAVGLLAVFLIPRETAKKSAGEGYFKNLLYGLRPAVWRENPDLYLSFAAFCLFSVAVQVFFPFLIIYLQNYLGITDYAIVLGVVLILASAVSVVSGRVIDRVGKLRFVFPAAGVMLAGLLGMYFVRKSVTVMAAGTVMMSGYMMLTAALGANIRDWTPPDRVGHFQGIRMIFAVLLPMIFGPLIGAAVIRGSDSTYIELGQVKTVPTPEIYLAAGAVLLLCFVPVLLLRRREKQDLKAVFRAFPTDGEAVSFTPVRSGHINQTFLAETDCGAKYILQRVNENVFPDVDAIMENIALMREELEREGQAELTPRFLKTRDGKPYFTDAAGGAWRVYPFVPNSVSRLRPESADDLHESGLAFGSFLHALRGLPAERLRVTIPDFHNTPLRFAALKQAAEKDVCGRRKEAEAELGFALEREGEAGALWRAYEAGTLPKRAAHNDTKLSNVLFDETSGKAVCVIDLDTVMPGLAAWDFGDAVRSGAGTAAEDAAADAVRLDLDSFRAFSKGFLAACPDLTAAELSSLVPGAWTMTLECGVRFLTDWLEGDRYFAAEREGQNLDRCRAQFALLRDMEAKRAEMERIVSEAWSEQA